MAFRLLHTGDWQLGMTRHFLDADAQARFTQARFEAIVAIGRLAREQSCEAVVCCGDVFEHNAVDRKTISRACEALAKIAVPVFLLPGNQDRKSTRLNSSHSQISYAVFCLKKKKKRTYIHNNR